VAGSVGWFVLAFYARSPRLLFTKSPAWNVGEKFRQNARAETKNAFDECRELFTSTLKFAKLTLVQTIFHWFRGI